MQPILEFDNVTYGWGDGKGVEDISFQAHAGKVTLITGPSGAGKSTLLRLAARLEQPQKGEIRFSGIPVQQYPPQELRTRMGFVQQVPVLGQGTVRENLLAPFSFAANTTRTPPQDSTLQQWLEKMALDGVSLDDEALHCSVGQRQRLCLIRTLLLSPECLCMDEPASALDAESRHIVEAMVNTLAEEGKAVLLVSHSDFRPSAAYTHVVVRSGRVYCEQYDSTMCTLEPEEGDAAPSPKAQNGSAL